MKLEQIELKLKASGCKLTKQRRTLLEVFVENQSKLLSAEEIHARVNEKNPGTNFSTIYRNLDLLTACGIIHKLNLDGNAASYELADEAASAHHHLMICKDCGKTERLAFCPMEAILKKVQSDNFELTDHKLELYGYCKKCKNT